MEPTDPSKPLDFSPIYSDPVLDFVRVAREYMALMDRHEEYEKEEFLGRIQPLLALLYYHVLYLPEVSCTTFPKPPNPQPDSWSQLVSVLMDKFGTHNNFPCYFTPYEGPDPVVGSVAEDLADIYEDLGKGLRLWDVGPNEAKLDSIWHWRFMFRINWSFHVVDAISALGWMVHDCELHPPFGEYRGGVLGGPKSH